MKKMFFIGDQFQCPVCQTKLKSFPSGNCPSCGSSQRHRAFFAFLSKKTPFFNDRLNVLHFAPEFGLNRIFRNLSNLDYISADLSSQRAKMKINMTKIPFLDGYFDVVLSSHVLEHVDFDDIAMKELFRVQRKSGFSIHLVPINKNLNETFEDQNIKTDKKRQEVYGHYDHKRIYGLDYFQKLKDVGFKLKIYKASDYLTIFELDKYSISPEFEICYCKK